MSFADWIKETVGGKAETEFAKGSVSGNENPDYDLILDEALLAIDNGYITLESESIVSWAKSKGLSDEKAQKLSEEVIEMNKEPEKKPEDEDEEEGVEYEDDDEDGDEDEDDGEEETMKSAQEAVKVISEGLEEFQEFQKSASTEISTLGTGMAALIEENKAFKSSIEEQGKTIEFLKSEIARIGGEPAAKKNPAVGQADLTDLGIKPEERGHVLAIMRKGVAEKVLLTDDVLFFESKGSLTARAKAYYDKSLKAAAQ